MALTKARIVEALFVQNIFTKTQSARIVNIRFELIRQSLENGEDVFICGFGRFAVKEKQAHIGRNPKTGKAMKPIIHKNYNIAPRMLEAMESSNKREGNRQTGITEFWKE